MAPGSKLLCTQAPLGHCAHIAPATGQDSTIPGSCRPLCLADPHSPQSPSPQVLTLKGRLLLEAAETSWALWRPHAVCSAQDAPTCPAWWPSRHAGWPCGVLGVRRRGRNSPRQDLESTDPQHHPPSGNSQVHPPSWCSNDACSQVTLTVGGSELGAWGGAEGGGRSSSSFPSHPEGLSREPRRTRLSGQRRTPVGSMPGCWHHHPHPHLSLPPFSSSSRFLHIALRPLWRLVPGEAQPHVSAPHV